jgi:replicative DNA helicase
VFYDLRHRRIYDTLGALFDAKSAIDLITVQQALKDAGRLEEVGGLAYLADLPNLVPSAAHLDHYVQIVREKFVLRRIVAHCTEAAARAHQHEGAVDTLLDQVEHGIMRLGDDRFTSATWTAKQLVKKTSESIEHCIKAVGVVEMPTGFAYFDRLTGGLHPQEVFILAGRPSAGKTSLAMNMAENMSIEGHKPIGVLSLEMSAEQLMMRMMCSRGRVNFHTLRTGFPDKETLDTKAHKMGEKLCVAGMKIGTSQLFIDDSPGMSILQVRSKLRQLKHRHGIKAAVIDYIQLIDAPGFEENPVQAMRQVSKGIKAAAKELCIPIVAISQLSRESEKRGGRPRMSDLRESGAIEQDADLIGILFKKEAGTDEEKEREDALRQQIRDNPHAETELEVIMEVCKNRNGPQGDVFFRFLRWCMRFEDLQRPSRPDALPMQEEPL